MDRSQSKRAMEGQDVCGEGEDVSAPDWSWIMSRDIWLGIAAVVVLTIAKQYEIAYLMGMVTALQYVQEKSYE